MIYICFILYANCIFLDDFKLIKQFFILLHYLKSLSYLHQCVYFLYTRVHSIISRKKIVNGMTEIVDS